MKLKVITSNPGKVAEYQKSFDGLGIEMEHLKHPYDEVQSSDLEEVVHKGMDELISAGIRNFIVDDSGLFVDSLKGFPGVWSAYAQKTIGNPGILKLMDPVGASLVMKEYFHFLHIKQAYIHHYFYKSKV